MFLIFSAQALGNDPIELDSSQLAHVRARRLTDGEQIHVGDGKGLRRTGRLRWNSKKSAVVELDDVPPERRIEDHLTLLTAVPKPSRRDWMIEKCTELGCSEFVPCDFRRSMRQNIDSERFRRISMEAAAQSERWYLPSLAPPVDSMHLEERLRQGLEQGAMVYLADIAENRKDLELSGEPEHQKAQGLQSSQISGTRANKEAIRIAIVGPEGGFDDEERRIWKELQRDFADQFKTIQISN
ncbi:MAG: RsmE family RNA methyltransferase, partial [Leptospiraceae bacterium]|nr:RsmE family RNA methyltransferase [Leptospiraceae bacterium]